MQAVIGVLQHLNDDAFHRTIAAHRIETTAGDFTFGKLVLATGAEALVPPVSGSELMYTLNSQQEYRRCEENLRDAKRVLLIGGGLIGTELAMDLNRAGKQVTLVDRSGSLQIGRAHV